MKLGYFISSEEWGPNDIVAQAVKAKAAGFDRLFEAYREQVLPRFAAAGRATVVA